MGRREQLQAELSRRAALRTELARRQGIQAQQADVKPVQPDQPEIKQEIIPSSEMLPGQAPPRPKNTTLLDDAAKQISNVGNVIHKNVVAPIEAGVSMVGNVAGEAISGLAGLATLPFDDAEQAESNIEAVRNALKVVPPTKEGMETLRKIADTLQPAGETIEAARTQLGDATFEATNSPLAAAIAKTVPDALLSVVGLKSQGLTNAAKSPITLGKTIKNALSKSPKTLLKEAAPTIQDLKQAARKVYGDLDNSGFSVRAVSLERLSNEIADLTRKQGFNKAIQPKIAPVLKEFEQAAKSPKTLTEIDTLRKVAQGAARSIDPAEARMGSLIIERVDNFLDNLSSSESLTGKSAGIGEKFKDARQLWAKAKKLEVIEDAMSKANLQASGFENGIRTQFRSILNNKKKSRGFKPEELAAMRRVVKGGTAENIAKALGKFGVSEQQASSMMLSGLGAAAGGAVLGVPGAVAVPLIGQVSKSLAQKLTRNNAQAAKQIISAGKDGSEVVKAYMKAIPASERNVSELTELLLRPEINLKKLRASINPSTGPNSRMALNALFFAAALREKTGDSVE